MATPVRQGFFDLWFLPETEEPEHMYYIPASGVTHLPAVADATSVARDSLHPAWMAAAELGYHRCLVAHEPDVVLLHDTTGDPRLKPNAWATCPQHGAVAGPAFLLWRTAWGRRSLPMAASDMIQRRDDFHVAAWLIERHAAPVRERLKQHPAAYPMTDHMVQDVLDVLVPIHADLCASTVPVEMIGPLRDADQRVGQARTLLAEGLGHDAQRAAAAVTTASALVIPLLLELSRSGALSTLNLARVGADRVQAQGERQHA